MPLRKVAPLKSVIPSQLFNRILVHITKENILANRINMDFIKLIARSLTESYQEDLYDRLEDSLVRLVLQNKTSREIIPPALETLLTFRDLLMPEYVSNVKAPLLTKLVGAVGRWTADGLYDVIREDHLQKFPTLAFQVKEAEREGWKASLAAEWENSYKKAQEAPDNHPSNSVLKVSPGKKEKEEGQNDGGVVVERKPAGAYRKTQ